MEYLISKLLKQASGVKRCADDLPLDLTPAKFLRHTHDSFIEKEDLRVGTDYNEAIKVEVKEETGTYKSQIYFGLKTSGDANDSYSRQSRYSTNPDSNVQVKKEPESPCKHSKPHPFSIQGLLGDVIDKDVNTVTSPAVVSSHSVQGLCTNYSRNIVQSVKTLNYEDAFWCHACNELCKDYKSAQGHQYLHSIQRVKCSLKQQLFKQHGYVSKHVRLGDEKMECGLCHKIVSCCFFTKHQSLHHGHVCDICQQEFTNNSRLQDHMNIHIGSTPFSCKVCYRKFAKRSSLTQHMRYHRDHNSFKCRFCPKSFNSKYTRVVHERLHTGENPFKCQVPGCTRAFPQKIQLQLHMNSH